MSESYWQKFKKHFDNIILNTNTYSNIVKSTLITSNNILLNSIKGFPLDLFLDYILKEKFKLQNINKRELTWNKTVVYKENQHFIEIDLQHPDIPKDMVGISQFILHIIQSRNVSFEKHCIVLKHIDLLTTNIFYEFRILFEKYLNNAFFICTTNSLAKIEGPIKSRFTIFRIPLFTHEEILYIFDKYLKTELNENLKCIKSRDIIKAIFHADILSEEKKKSNTASSNNQIILTKEFCIYNFPPFYDFMLTYDKNKDSLEAIRNMAYKCCQYNISILQIAEDYLKIIDNNEIPFIRQMFSKIPKKTYMQFKNNLKASIIKEASNTDYALCKTNKGREPIYIESFLCQILL